MTKSAGLLVRGKIFEKNNMVSNDLKLPNSARNAIKFFFWRRRKTAADGGSGGPAAVFFLKIPIVGVISDTAQKISSNYL